MTSSKKFWREVRGRSVRRFVASHVMLFLMLSWLLAISSLLSFHWHTALLSSAVIIEHRESPIRS